MRSPPLRGTCLALIASIATLTAQAAQKEAQPVLHVFLLAGQSNMEGHGVVDLDDARDYNGGKGTLAAFLTQHGGDTPWQNLRAADGTWAVRDDVFVAYLTAHGTNKHGPLTVGFAVAAGAHHFGPELGIGRALGERFTEPVLLIKTAWGGKSLAHDFRPPGAGGVTGACYTRMLAEYRAAIAAIATDFPALGQHQPRLQGIVWFQGWNDACDAKMTAEYQSNLVHLILDLRAAFADPLLPFVVGETGNHDSTALRSAQRQACADARVATGTQFVATGQFLQRAEDCPNTGHAHHWFGSGESYLRIGDALGNAMAELVTRRLTAATPPAATEKK